MPAKKTTAKKAAAKTTAKKAAAPAPAPLVDDGFAEMAAADSDRWELAFYVCQPCTVHEFALVAKKPAAQCRIWLTEQAAAGRVTRNGDLQWHYS